MLARTSSRKYAVPLTYRGRFVRQPRAFSGSRQLQNDAAPGSVVRVKYLDLGEQLPLSIGDRLRVLSNDGLPTAADRSNYVRCER